MRNVQWSIYSSRLHPDIVISSSTPNMSKQAPLGRMISWTLLLNLTSTCLTSFNTNSFLISTKELSLKETRSPYESDSDTNTEATETDVLSRNKLLPERLFKVLSLERFIPFVHRLKPATDKAVEERWDIFLYILCHIDVRG